MTEKKIPVTFCTKYPLLREQTKKKITEHSLPINRQIFWTAVANHNKQHINPEINWNTGVDSVLWTVIPTGTTIVLYASIKPLGSWRQPFWSRVQSSSHLLQCETCPWSTELPLSNGTSVLGPDTHSGRHGRKWVQVRRVRVQSFQVRMGGCEVQEDKLLWEKMCVCTCVYCFFCGSDASVSRATRWHRKTLSVSVGRVWSAEVEVWPVCERESPCRGNQNKKVMRAAARPLVLRILHGLSVLDAAVIVPLLLFVIVVVVVLLFFTDQELLWRPAKLSALDFSLCRLDHDGRQAIFELTAAVEVWWVREYLGKKKMRIDKEYLVRNLSLSSGVNAGPYLWAYFWSVQSVRYALGQQNLWKCCRHQYKAKQLWRKWCGD